MIIFCFAALPEIGFNGNLFCLLAYIKRRANAIEWNAQTVLKSFVNIVKPINGLVAMNIITDS